MVSRNKSNDTAIRALDVLRMLCQGEYNMEDMIKLLFKDDEETHPFRTDALYKYFNTFKLFGMNIVRNDNNMFSLEKLPVTVTLSREEIAGIKCLLKYAHIIYPQDSKNEVLRLIKKLCDSAENYNFNDLISEINWEKAYNRLNIYSYNPDLLNRFRMLCKDGQRISFNYSNAQLNETQTFVVEPEEVIVTPVGCILKAYNPEIAETQNFYIESIEDLKQLPFRSKSVNVRSSVTFALKGRLASAYELKPGERVSDMAPNYLVVTNVGEDRTLLMKRLLRYGKSCEILYPKIFRKKTLATLKNILKNYE